MGDAYARIEFRRHRDAKTTPAQWKAFTQEWDRYVNMLRGNADLPEQSGDIADSMLQNLNDDQQRQLAKLREETASAHAEIMAAKQKPQE